MAFPVEHRANPDWMNEAMNKSKAGGAEMSKQEEIFEKTGIKVENVADAVMGLEDDVKVHQDSLLFLRIPRPPHLVVDGSQV